MGQQGPHAKLLSQHQGLAVIAFSLLELGRISMISDLVEQPQSPCLVTALLMGSGGMESALGNHQGFL